MHYLIIDLASQIQRYISKYQKFDYYNISYIIINKNIFNAGPNFAIRLAFYLDILTYRFR